MKVFWRCRIVFITIIVIHLSPWITIAADERSGGKPWENFSANLGVFVSALDSSFRLGSGVGLEIDVEQLLGLDNSGAVFRTDALWRFSKNRRHRLDFTWFSLNRDGDRRLLDDITIENENGDDIVIPAGTSIEGNFDLDIYEIAYSYSFFQDDRLDLAAGIGLYIMPLDFGIKSERIDRRRRQRQIHRAFAGIWPAHGRRHHPKMVHPQRCTGFLS